MESTDVWYAAYGSNLAPVRLREYLDGCRSAEAPVDARPIRIPHRLLFAHHSERWGGGPAFVDPEVDRDAGTLATAWLLGRAQFLDVLAMENGAPAGSLEDTALPSRPGEAVSAAGGRYGLIVAVPSPDDRPAYTFTTGERPLPPRTRPGSGYVAVIVSGLVDGHGLTEREALDYLAERGA